MEVQTRSDSTVGKYAGLHLFPSVKEAHNAANEDPNVYKIGWSIPDTSIRVSYRRKIKGKAWDPVTEDKLNFISETYKNCQDPKATFWMLFDVGKLFSAEFVRFRNETGMSMEGVISECITGILTEEQFVAKYCS